MDLIRPWIMSLQKDVGYGLKVVPTMRLVSPSYAQSSYTLTSGSISDILDVGELRHASAFILLLSTNTGAQNT
jgi:hypothetical protein